MRIVELIIDEQDEQSGIDAISVVMSPAIESNFIHLSKHEVELKEIDAEKRILMGAALIPNKQIYRKNEKTKDEYYIYFSEATIRKASELFLMNANQNNSTLEHSTKLKGMSVVESWIVEGENDKSKNYGFNFPKGTWVISMKVNNEEIWDKVKLGEVKGFSIEGYFADKLEMSLKNNDMEEKVMIEKIKSLIEKSELKSEKVELAIPDQLISIIKNSKTLDNKFDELSKLYTKYNVEGNILLKESKADLIKLEQEDARISKLVKDLGLNPSDLPYLKDSGNAYSLLSKIVDRLESGLKK
jgi:hypothetical protein